MSRWVLPALATLLAGGAVAGLPSCLGAEYRKVGAGGAGGGGGATGGGGEGDCSPLTEVPSAGCDAEYLADADSCCVAGRSCLGAACENGFCQPNDFTDSPGEAIDVVLVGDLVIWSTGGLGQLAAAPQSGEGATSIVAADGNDNAYTTALATDGEYVYWVPYGDTVVHRADPTEGLGAEEAVADTAPEEGGWGRIDVRGEHVFWVTAGLAEGGTMVGNSVWMAAKDGTDLNSPIQVYQGGLPHGVAVDDTHVYWTDQADPPSGGGVWRLPIEEVGTGTPEPWVVGQDWITDIVVDNGDVYWLDGGTVYWRATSGGAVEVVGNSDSGWSLALDEIYVYWTDEERDEVFRAFRLGSSPTLSLAQGDNPKGIVVGCQAVYYANWADTSPQWMSLVRK